MASQEAFKKTLERISQEWFDGKLKAGEAAICNAGGCDNCGVTCDA